MAKLTKYICDKCKVEIGTEHDLYQITAERYYNRLSDKDAKYDLCSTCFEDVYAQLYSIINRDIQEVPPVHTHRTGIFR